MRAGHAAAGGIETLVIAEGLALPLDEGGTISTVKMIESLPAPVMLLNRTNGTTPPTSATLRQFAAGQSRIGRILRYLRFVAATLWTVVQRRPGHVYYVPLRDPPIALQLHAAALALLARDFTEVLFQVGQPTRLFAAVSRFRIQVISQVDQQRLAAAGIRAVYAPPHFKRPAARAYDKAALRRHYGVPRDAFVVSHIGHPNPFRGLDTLATIAKRDPGITFVLLLSSRLPPGEFVFPENVIVISRQIEDVHEIYAMSDVYFFPLRSHSGAISTPLSLLEASEAGLAILCSDLPTLRAALKGYDKAEFVDIGGPDPAAAFAERLANLKGAIGAES